MILLPANIVAVFTTGLLAGGISCMAVQGGLLAATVVQGQDVSSVPHKKIITSTVTRLHTVFPVITFLVSKLAAYTILGYFLGLAGSILQLSYGARVVLDFAVVIFMLGTALALLRVHPIFRFFIIQPPQFLSRWFHSESNSRSIFAPAILGFMTVLIPCGTTQAIMALAVASGNAFAGAALLFAFTLGTMPLFLGLGLLTSKLGIIYRQRFMKFAALAIIVFAIFNLNSAIALAGSPVTLDSAWSQIACKLDGCAKVDAATMIQSHYAAESTAPQQATITITQNGYTPQDILLRAGSPVSIKLINIDNTNCAQSFTVPSLQLQKIVTPGQSATVSFTTPKMSGSIAFMCSAGNYKGNIYLD